ncbi:equilibrative nucleoside transporter 3-like isoform X2 [Euwallacea similis]
MILAISAVVNTDNVQLLYFIGVLFAYGVLSGENTVNLLASAKLYVRFPRKYMKTCLLGQSTGGVIGDILNIISVAIFKDLVKSTLLYFIIACVAISLTMMLFGLLLRSEFFKESLESIPENVDKKMHSIQELRHLLYKIKYPTIILLYFMLTTEITHTSVTSLIVSEQHEDKTIWAENYFSPVMTFLLSDTFQLLGRLYLTFYSFHMPEKVFYVVGSIRMALLVPFIWMCNAQPRHHLPVLFSHDYQYGIIIAVFMFTSGILINWSVLLVPKLVEKHETDIAYTVYTFAMNICDIFIAPLGILVVNVI